MRKAHDDLLVSFDQHGSFRMAELYEITGIESPLKAVMGGGIDGSCGNNHACFSEFNDYCVNTNVCGDNLGCIENVGCTN